MTESGIPSGDEVAYWRALAAARQRKLEELRARLLAAIATIPDEHVRAFVAALDGSRPAWIRELDSMPGSTALESADILGVLDDLWRQVGAERGR